MFHPATELRRVSSVVGYGVFATANIPMGSIVYIHDSTALALGENNCQKLMNGGTDNCLKHSCDSNTLYSSYGFGIAVRNIFRGEQLTINYDMLKVAHDAPCHGDNLHCQQHLGITDHPACANKWEQKIKSAMEQFIEVSQPLLNHLPADTFGLLETYINHRAD